MNSRYSASVQNAITRSTPARLYQLLSNKTISPAEGRCATYRWQYHCVFSFSVGVGGATIWHTRGLRHSEMRYGAAVACCIAPFEDAHQFQTAGLHKFHWQT